MDEKYWQKNQVTLSCTNEGNENRLQSNIIYMRIKCNKLEQNIFIKSKPNEMEWHEQTK